MDEDEMAPNSLQANEIKAHIMQELDRLTGSAAMAEMMLQELAPMFLEDSAVLLADLATAVAQHQPPHIQQLAHTFKGSSASLGITRLSQLCLELEKIARANEMSLAGAKFHEIQAEYALVAQLLQGVSAS